MRKIIAVCIISLLLLFGAGCLTDDNPSHREPVTVSSLTTFSARGDGGSVDIILDGVTKQVVKSKAVAYTIDPKDLAEGSHSLSFSDSDTTITWDINIVHSNSTKNPKSDEWYQSYQEQVKRAQERNNNATT